jgi:predicted transcriptional regulator
MLNKDTDQDEDIFIIKYKKESEYTTIFNQCLNDEDLSTDSVAILAYVMSKPNDWKINIKNISNRYKIGRDKVRNSINNLIQYGYMKRVRRRKKDGSLSNILIYASDKPMFLSENSQLSENQEAVVAENYNKQPETEIQAVVTTEPANKQPRPENPALVNQAVDSLYSQKKDVNKENNNNKITTNPKGARATPPSDGEVNLYSDSSVVVFMKKIEGSGVPESTLVGWLKKHGTDYVAEKIRIYQSKGALANPGGFLSAAIAYDWKEKTSVQTPALEPKDCRPTDYPTPDENREWFRQLSDNEKSGLRQLALVKHNAFDEMLKQAKTSILDPGFPDTFLFKMLMEFVGRAKR